MRKTHLSIHSLAVPTAVTSVSTNGCSDKQVTKSFTSEPIAIHSNWNNQYRKYLEVIYIISIGGPLNRISRKSYKRTYKS